MAQEVTCSSPSDLLNLYGCLSCLSYKELLAVFVLAFANNQQYDLPDDTNQLLEDSACLTCLTEKQAFQAIVALVGNQYLSDMDIETLRDQIKCLLCAQPRQLRAAAVYLICENLNSRQ